jgi:hypothetical protein
MDANNPRICDVLLLETPTIHNRIRMYRTDSPASWLLAAVHKVHRLAFFRVFRHRSKRALA